MDRHFGSVVWDVKEERLFCLGKVGGRILTVRLTYREGSIRIYGGGLLEEREALL